MKKEKKNTRKSTEKSRKATKEARESWVNDQCKMIYNSLEKNKTATAFKTVRDLTWQKSTRATVIDDKDGNLLTDKNAITKRWKEYCEELYNYQITADQSMLTKLQDIDTSEVEDPPILRAEVEAAMKDLKCGKSPGVDNVPGELIKYGGEAVIDACRGSERSFTLHFLELGIILWS